MTQQRWLSLFVVFLALINSITPSYAVSVSSKTYSFTNGTANDAAPVDASFTSLFNNDSTLGNAVTQLENGNVSNATTLTLNSSYTGSSPSNMSFMVERGTLPNTGFRWNESNQTWELSNDGSTYSPFLNVALLNSFNTTTVPTYISNTTFSVRKINATNSSNDGVISKTGSSTVDTTTTGLNGIAQSAALAGTAAVSAGTSVTGTSTTFNTDFQVGDVICVTGAECRRITAVGGSTSITVESAFSSTVSGASYKRGGRAPNTWYNLYAITNGNTPGLILSSRNVSTGETLIDLPSGYTKSRQLAFATRLDASSNILPFWIETGWPERPKVMFDISTNFWPAATSANALQLLSGGSTGSFTDIDTSTVLPAISRQGVFLFYPYGSGWNSASFKTKGSASNGYNFRMDNNNYNSGVVFTLPTDSSRYIQYKYEAGTSNTGLAGLGFVVTEVP